MEFSEYQRETERTSRGDLTHENRVANAVFGLCGEAGEVADLLKKNLFHSHTLDESKLKYELGDVIWYVAYLCRIFKFDMNEIAQMNVDKLRARYPDGFSTELSINRKPNDV